METGHFLKMLNDATRILDVECPGMRNLQKPIVGTLVQGWTKNHCLAVGLPGVIIGCKNLALYIRDCASLRLSDETLKAVGPFYLGPRL